MSFLVAVSGKGGVGKTTVAALIVRRLISQGRTPILAVDADPNTCLDLALGVRAENTIGAIREETKKLAASGEARSVSKQELLELKIAQALVEAEKFDYIAMGRPEGPGCYCYANNVLRSVLSRLADHYPAVVLDNEAGLENLSRRIVRQVDALVLVSDGSRAGRETLLRLHSLAREMEIACRRLDLVINRVRGGTPAFDPAELQRETGAKTITLLPDDPGIAQRAEEGLSLLEGMTENPVVQRVAGLTDRLASEEFRGHNT